MIESNGTIIAGADGHEKIFNVPLSVLKKSPVINDWIHEKESIPPDMVKGDALYFANVDFEVVQATIDHLSQKPWKTMTASERLASARSSKTRDVVFQTKMYKFALCLGLGDLCQRSLWYIQDLTQNTQVFLDVLSISMKDKNSLVDDSQFRKWLMEYIAQNKDKLTNSKLFKDAVIKDSELAWKLCSLLMSSLEDKEEPHQLRTPDRSAHCTPHNSSSLKITPDLLRRESNPYTYTPRQRSPSRRRDSKRIRKSQKEHPRKFCATVEDTVDEDDDIY